MQRIPEAFLCKEPHEFAAQDPNLHYRLTLSDRQQREHTLGFLLCAFGAVELRRFPDSTAKLMHAEVCIDDTVVMLTDGGQGWPPIPSHVHVYVADADAMYKRALDLGATSVQEPVKKDDADRHGGMKDAGGTRW